MYSPGMDTENCVVLSNGKTKKIGQFLFKDKDKSTDLE